MKLKLVLTFLFIFLFSAAKGVSANEGIFRLAPTNSSNVSCFVTSVYQNGSYKMLGTCRGLVMAFSAEQTRYALWKVEDNKKVIYVTDIDGGKITGASGTKFNELFITAEKPSYVRQPEGVKVAGGTLEQIDFVGRDESEDSRILTPTPTVKNTSILNRNNNLTTDNTDQTVGSRLQGLLRAIGRVIIIGFLILLVVVIVMTVITRRKEKQIE